MYRLVFRGSRRRKRGFGFILKKKERPGKAMRGRKREGERIWESYEKEAAHFSCFSAERGERALRIFHGECKFGLKYHGKM